MVLEKELLHVDMQATGSRLTHGSGLSIYETSKSIPTVTHFLQQGYTYTSKVTRPDSATPLKAIFFFQTTIGEAKTKDPASLEYTVQQKQNGWNINRLEPSMATHTFSHSPSTHS